MPHETTPRHAPIYASYLTFTNLLDWLREIGTIPSRLVRSFWGQRFSDDSGARLMSGLRFLGLLEGDTPTERLEELALASDEQRREPLTQLLRDVYGSDFIDSLPRSTPKLVDERLRELGTTDSTHNKARSFFINAARAVDLQMQPQVTKQARLRSPVSKKNSSKQKKTTEDQQHIDQHVEVPRQAKTGRAAPLHPALAPLLQDLAVKGPVWDVRLASRWKATWSQVLDYAYPVAGDDEVVGEGSE